MVEIVSRTNTAGELERKRGEYLAAGVCEIWEIDIDARQAIVHATGASPRIVAGQETLVSEALLPGFSVPLSTLLQELDRHG